MKYLMQSFTYLLPESLLTLEKYVPEAGLLSGKEAGGLPNTGADFLSASLLQREDFATEAGGYLSSEAKSSFKEVVRGNKSGYLER